MEGSIRIPAPSPLAQSGANLGRFRRGDLIHRLLDRLPEIAPPDRADAARRGLDVEIVGPVPHDEVNRQINRARVGVVCGRDDGAPAILTEYMLAGLPVLVSDVCGYAHYIADADCGRVVPSPFEQRVLDQMLAQMLADAAQRSAWSRNALAFAETADLYSMPQKAADVILGESA
mgnify:CR=1 FL=1